MIKAVFDTNVNIDRINRGFYSDVFDFTLQHLSGVVLMELYAGAFSNKDQNLVDKLERIHRKVQPLLLPMRMVFREAGTLL